MNWFAERKREFEEIYKNISFPAKDEEEWRRTAPSAFDFEHLVSSVSNRPYHAGHISKNGEKGTNTYPLFEAPEEAEKYFGKLILKENKFIVGNSAFVNNGVFVKIEKGADIKKPVCLNMETGAPSIYKAVIAAGKNSRATVLIDISGGSRCGLVSFSCELFIEKNAEITIYSIETYKNDINSISSMHAELKENSRLKFIDSISSSSRHKKTVKIRLVEDGANAYTYGNYFPQKNEHIDIYAEILHDAKNTKGDALFKSACNGKGRFIFQGLVKITEKGEGTDSYIANRNLILGSSARADSIPKLEIATSKVKASHGSSTGKLSENEIFYLTSRGIPENKAKSMIVHGFFEEIMKKVESPDALKMFESIIKKRVKQL